MSFKPILLETSLGAIFHGIADTFWTSVIWNELLVKLFVLFHISGWVINAILLILPYMLQWALVILALADMYHLVIGRMWSLNTDAHSGHVHHR